MTNKSCFNCNACVQYQKNGWYPEFKCSKNGSIYLDGFRFPSNEKSCEKWEMNQANSWKLVKTI